MSDFEIFMWKYGLNIFTITMLVIVSVIHWQHNKEYKRNKEFLKHIR